MTTNKPEVVAYVDLHRGHGRRYVSLRRGVDHYTLSDGDQLIRLRDYEALQAECEQLRKDAERYQWLREQNAKPADECSGLASIAVVFDDDDGGVWVGACLDTAIDEAMQETTK